MNSVIRAMRAMRKKMAYAPPQRIPPQLPTLQRAQQNTAPPQMPGAKHVMGSGVPQTGLPAQRTMAATVPGMQGTAAANPIDMHGALGPPGTVDGNHASGVQKGFKIG